MVIAPTYISSNTVRGFFFPTHSSIYYGRLFDDDSVDQCEEVLHYSFDLHFSSN